MFNSASMIGIRGLVLAGLCAVLVACGGDDTSSWEHLESARGMLQEGKNRDAIIELKNALRKDINNTTARALLGQSYYALGDYQSAEKELTRALEQGVNPTSILPMLSQALLSLGELEKLQQLPLDGLGPEDRSLVQAAKGLGLLFQSDMTGAQELIGIALENEPRSPYAEVAAARLSMGEEDYDLARQQLQRIFKSYPDYVPAWNMLGDINAAEKKPERAEKAYSRVIQLAPGSFDARLNRAMMRIYQNNFKGAQQDLQTLSKTHGGVAAVHPGVNFAWGVVHLRFRRHVPAGKAFEVASRFSDAYPLTHYYLAAIEMEKGNYEQATSHIYRFLNILPRSVVGAKLAAKLELRQGGNKTVVKLLKPVVEAYPDDVDALNMLGSAYLATGKGAEGIELLARVAQLQPDSSEARARLGAGFLATGEEAMGLETLQSLIKADPTYEQADILIVLNHLRRRNTEAAIETAEAYQSRNPDSTTSFNLLGRAYLAGNRPEQARAAFEQALLLRPDDPGANISLAEFKLAEEDFAGAREHYQRILAANPNHMQTLMKKAASYALEGREDKMFESLNATIERHPRAMEPHLIKARFFIARGDLENAYREFNALSAEQKAHPDALVTRAGFELAEDRFTEAHRTLEKLIRKRPNVSQYHYMRAKALAGSGDTENFARALERAVELDPDHFYAKLALARLSLMNGDDEKFNTLLADLRAVAPQNQDVMKLDVVAADKRGDYAHAAGVLQVLYDETPTVANAVALAGHYEKTGEWEAAVAVLSAWLTEKGDNLQVRARLSQVYSAQGRVDDAIEQYQAILELDDSNLIALNNMAWYLLDRDRVQALTYAERAFGVAPNAASVLDTLAMAQMKNGKLAEARRTIDRALRDSPANPDMRFHEAQIRALEGDRVGAIERVSQVLADHETFFEREAAEAFLAELTQG